MRGRERRGGSPVAAVGALQGPCIFPEEGGGGGRCEGARVKDKSFVIFVQLSFPAGSVVKVEEADFRLYLCIFMFLI